MLWSMKFEHSAHINGLQVTGTPNLINPGANTFPTTCSMCISDPRKKLLLVHKLTNTGTHDADTSSDNLLNSSLDTLSLKTNLVDSPFLLQWTYSPNDNHTCTEAPARTASSSNVNRSTNCLAFDTTVSLSITDSWCRSDQPNELSSTLWMFVF